MTIRDGVIHPLEEFLRVVAGVKDAAGFCPISSSLEYLLMAQNLSLRDVMVPSTSVVATMACWSSANL